MPNSDINQRDRRPILWWTLRLAILGGCASLIFFLYSVLTDAYHAASVPGAAWQRVEWLPLSLTAVVLCYAIVQVLPTWITYLAASVEALRIRDTSFVPAPEWGDALTVDVFVTAYKEPIGLVERTLCAAYGMRGPHRTYLLDDGGSPELRRLAAHVGAGYIARTDTRDAKAGNLNHAIAQTSGEVIAVFDVDHVPEADYLERSLVFFADKRMGFVQSMITFSPNPSYWVAGAAAETSYDYYNPTSRGMHLLGGVSMMGTNSLIRREALATIGGYRPGLAEDLATSIALHAAGWRSAYVAEPLAPGLAPPNVAAWITQQMKWGRGVFEVFLTEYPKLFRRLTGGQRVCYLVRMTKYLIGTVLATHLIATALLLLVGTSEEQLAFQRYLLAALPLAVSDVVIRQIALAAARHPSLRNTSVWRAIALVFYSWPVYSLAWIMAVARRPLAFRATPKGADERIGLMWVLPQAVSVAALGYGVLSTLARGRYDLASLLLVGAVQCLLQVMVLCQRLRPSRLQNYLIEARAKFESDTTSTGSSEDSPPHAA